MAYDFKKPFVKFLGKREKTALRGQEKTQARVGDSSLKGIFWGGLGAAGGLVAGVWSLACGVGVATGVLSTLFAVATFNPIGVVAGAVGIVVSGFLCGVLATGTAYCLGMTKGAFDAVFKEAEKPVTVEAKPAASVDKPSAVAALQPVTPEFGKVATLVDEASKAGIVPVPAPKAPEARL